MNKFDRMQAIKKLEEDKQFLLKQVSKVDKELEIEKEECDHIYVDLGYYGKYLTREEYLCLICGKGKDAKFYYKAQENRIHAEKYMQGFNLTDESQCMKKFEHIQELALDILREYPNISDKELTDRVNTIIEKSTSSKEKTKVVKLVPVSKIQK